MKQTSSSKASKTDWNRVRALSDEEISRTAEHPEASTEHIVRGIVRLALGPPKRSI